MRQASLTSDLTVINVKGRQVEIDIREELEEYSWHNARWTPDKLIASSPFRDDQAPSFFVNLQTGAWGDSGAVFDEYRSGNYVKLIALLNGWDYDTAAEHICDKLGILYDYEDDESDDVPYLKFATPTLDVADTTLTRPHLSDVVTFAVSPYLTYRAIDEDVQKALQVGYNEDNAGYTAIPWHYADTGEVANVKYRQTKGKRFFYESGGESIGRLVYGLHHARKSLDSVVICEAEIDVMSWLSVGINAVATGSANISRRQAELIRRSGFRTIYAAGDMDEQGRMFNDMIVREFRGYAELRVITDMRGYKDANDVLRYGGHEALADVIRTYESISSFTH